MDLTCGESMRSLPTLTRTPSNENAFHAVLIDGGHLYVNAFMDIINGARAALPGALVLVDDCSTSPHSPRGSGSRPDLGVYELHVSLAFGHAVALGVLEPLRGDVCGDADLCLARYKNRDVDGVWEDSVTTS